MLIASVEPLELLDELEPLELLDPAYPLDDDAAVPDEPDAWFPDDAALEFEPELLPHAATVKATAATAASPPTRNRALFHLFMRTTPKL